MISGERWTCRGAQRSAMREAIEGRSITPADNAKPEIKGVLIGADVRPQYEKHAANRVNTAGDLPTDQARIIEVITPKASTK
jgi:hypothetical protein